MRSFHFPGRSAVLAETAMAATSHPLATATAVAILRDGGNAVDAAVAAAAVLAVVEPCQTGLGGDGFALIARDGQPVRAYDGSGRAPAAADAAALLARGIDHIDFDSALSATVPGTVGLWARLLQDHGTRGLDSLLVPAIGYAADGHPIQPRIAYDWVDSVEKLNRFEDSRAVFLPWGRPPEVGERFAQPRLARALRLIAEQGPDALYRGPIGADIVETCRRHGGLLEMADLASHATEENQPLQAAHGGLQVWQCPPNGQGVVALLMLKVLARLRPRRAPYDPAWAKAFVAATREAYRLRDAGDWEALQSDTAADAIAARIRSGTVAPAVPPRSADTVYLCVVDADRLAVSLINSVYKDFGSGIVTRDYGLALQNRGAGFTVQPGHPLCIGPRRRPLHTIMPGLVTEAGAASLVFGMTGGDFQPAGQVLLLTAMAECGHDPQEAIDLARFFALGAAVQVEEGVPDALCAALADAGHTVERRRLPLGCAQAIRIDRARGLLIGGSDPRADGCVLGW